MRLGKDVCSATGFFYRTHGQPFLVTNRHVVIDEKKRHFPDSLRIRVHSDPTNFQENVDIQIPLYDGEHRKLWLEHPVRGGRVDLAALRLKGLITGRHVVSYITAKMRLPNDLVVRVGEDAVAVGFPLGFHDDVYNLPVLRSGMLATPYPIGFRGTPCFLIDARLHEGMSGSPLFTKPQIGLLHKKGGISLGPSPPQFFLGVVSATLPPFVGDNPLGLNVAWFSDLVEEIAAQKTLRPSLYRGPGEIIPWPPNRPKLESKRQA
jgi:hypothetical protein